ncbi:MAG: hypothetical protein CVV64_05015 [Candidatus Wallbacteria bacterium HGW-Wallbacteria-1]|jgi:phosphoribosyl 1,2-cyclic phosphodiesterase|uniref:Metallo-beta-lactamase domain-containing protein n=1 Tax=Candidatus Wallbacteria bacterium HGW-Wallbacteria-1 TaxID=2013854 RepID=A0A2N1PS24_9BACT|nr:MAG: hypothetical protein CVV64_05015 [Candidatus Wallbacteria bacterium HGW-Wallbacteria-1]
MKIRFWGVRGFIPVPGPTTTFYGGNTPCIEIMGDQGELVIVDSGTGIRKLGLDLMGRGFGPKGPGGKGIILITHTHWDHIQGFPFFPPLFLPGNDFALHGAKRGQHRLESILEGQMNPNFNPVHSLTNLGATIRFVEMDEESEHLTWGNLRISSMAMTHARPAEVLAFRIDEGSRSVTIMTDVCLKDPRERRKAAQFARESSILIHDCSYLDSPSLEKTRGLHSSLGTAVAVAEEAGAKVMMPFHYPVEATDTLLDDLFAGYPGSRVEIRPSREGLCVDV